MCFICGSAAPQENTTVRRKNERGWLCGPSKTLVCKWFQARDPFCFVSTRRITLGEVAQTLQFHAKTQPSIAIYQHKNFNWRRVHHAIFRDELMVLRSMQIVALECVYWPRWSGDLHSGPATETDRMATGMEVVTADVAMRLRILKTMGESNKEIVTSSIFTRNHHQVWDAEIHT